MAEKGMLTMDDATFRRVLFSCEKWPGKLW